MKKILFAAFLLSLLGTGAELLLLEHTQDAWQLIPVILIGLALVAFSWFAATGSKVSQQVLRGVMLFFIVSGILGFALHYKGNMEFEMEMYPSMKGTKLIWETLKGATPVLAPGSMAATGLLGWAYTMK
ncbi:MAG: hypothetical protein HRU41_40185 [Saprospiraceae bacterium]|nr:hypothetical protein [Saprospiraceae bacterium]